MDYYNEQNGWVLWKLIKVLQKLTMTRINLLICNWSALYVKIKPATVIKKCSTMFLKNQLTIQAHMTTKWKLHCFIDSPSKVDPSQWSESYESSRVIILVICHELRMQQLEGKHARKCTAIACGHVHTILCWKSNQSFNKRTTYY
jgi:hypothetical protein